MVISTFIRTDCPRFALEGHLALLLALLVALPCLAQNQPFVVSGKIIQEAYEPDGSVMFTRRQTFSVAVRKGAWLLTVIPSKDQTPSPGLVSWEVGSEVEGEICELERYDGREFQDSRIAATRPYVTNSETKTRIHGMGCIVSGDVPVSHHAPAGLLWLAFASTEHLKTNASGRLKQVWETSDNDLRYRPEVTTRAEWELDVQSRLPQRVQFYNEGSWKVIKAGKSVAIAAPKPYDRGFLTALYEVRSWTNLQSIRLPLELSFSRYSIKALAQSSNDLRRISTTTVTVSECAAKQEPSYLPQLPNVAIAINDFRKYSQIASAIVYASSNRWPTVTQVASLKTYNAQHSLALGRKTLNESNWSARSKKRLFAFVVLCIVISGLLLLSKRVRTTATTIHTNK